MVAENDNRLGEAGGRGVTIGDEYEARLWADRFAVSREALRRAVEAVGSDPMEVGAWLQARRASAG